MKFISLFLLLLVVGGDVLAEKKFGSSCGLTDTHRDGWAKRGPNMTLDSMSDRAVRKLPSLTKQQLIITAKHFSKKLEDSPLIRNSVDAVDFLRENSEWSELEIQDYRIRGEEYTEVLHYPGGSPFGLIFLRLTRRIVASNVDGTIYCR